VIAKLFGFSSFAFKFDIEGNPVDGNFLNYLGKYSLRFF
jgi:hypothetical protein